MILSSFSADYTSSVVVIAYTRHTVMVSKHEPSLSSAPPSWKRKCLMLEDRIKVVNRSDKGEIAISIAKSLHVWKTQNQRIIRDQESIQERRAKGDSTDRLKKRQWVMFTDLNAKVYKWTADCRQKNIPICGRFIQEKALMLSNELGHDNFTASNRWLEKWCKRNQIKSSCLSGE